jgi:hypothetical protein
MLILLLLGAAAATAAGVGATVLTGETEIAVSEKIFFELVQIDPHSSEPANSSAIVRIGNDRLSYTTGFLTDQGDTVIFKIKIRNLAGTGTLVKILAEVPILELEDGTIIELMEVGYSMSDTTIDFGDVLRRILHNEWVIYVPANSVQEFYQWLYVSTCAPPGQYQVLTSIQQKY